MNEIKIDPEFQSLIPAMSQDERQQLEANLIADGCREPLSLWEQTIVDGHNRHEICTRLSVPFETVQMSFDSRNDAVIWIIRNQFGRRNLPDYERAKLALRLKPAIAEKAKESYRENVGRPKESLQKSAPIKVDTRAELAKVAGVSHDTIAKVERIERAASPEVKQALTDSKVSINAAAKVSELPEDKQKSVFDSIPENAKPRDISRIIQEAVKKPHVSNNSGNNEWYTPSVYIEAARKVMGCIQLDPASCEIANKTVKAERIFTAENSGLDKEWKGCVWMNPPYAQPLMNQFAAKMADEVNSGNVSQSVSLVNNGTETGWFADLASVASCICFPKSRVKFLDPSGKPSGAPLQGQAIFYFGDNKSKFFDVFSDIGLVVEVMK
jgi:ParB family chromosome partitioning protein